MQPIVQMELSPFNGCIRCSIPERSSIIGLKKSTSAIEVAAGSVLLAIDIGNTNITLGAFEEGHLKSTWRLATDLRRLADEYGPLVSTMLPLKGVKPKDITDACICSVVPPLTSVFEQMCINYFKVSPLTVSAGVKTGIQILYVI